MNTQGMYIENQIDGSEALSVLVLKAAKDADAGRIEVAVDTYYNALDMAQRLDDKRIQKSCLIGLAIIARGQRNYEIAQEFCLEGLSIVEKTTRTPSQAILCFQLGVVHGDKQDFASAKIWHEKSISIWLDLDPEFERFDKLQLYSSYYQLGMVFRKLRQHADSYKQYESALNIAIQLGDLLRQMNCHERMAHAISNQHPPNEKRISFEEEKHWVQMLTLAETTNSWEQQAEAHGNIGVIYHELGQFEKAETSYGKAVSIYTSIGHKRADVWSIFFEGLSKKKRINAST